MGWDGRYPRSSKHGGDGKGFAQLFQRFPVELWRGINRELGDKVGFKPIVAILLLKASYILNPFTITQNICK